jgi:hypothetical protein
MPNTTCRSRIPKRGPAAGERCIPSKQIIGAELCSLADRVLVAEGKPQVYGTQAKAPGRLWKGHEPVPEPIEDERNVDKRRAEVGLPPLADYLKMMKEMYFPNDK